MFSSTDIESKSASHPKEESELRPHRHPISFAEQVGAVAVEPYLSFIGFEQSDDMLENDALAAAAGDDDDQTFPVLHVQIQMIQNELTPESLDDVA